MIKFFRAIWEYLVVWWAFLGMDSEEDFIAYMEHRRRKNELV